jgi:hypothetical protein
MDDRLRAIERAHGVFLRSEAREGGYDDKAVRTALKLKLWHRVRHGAYCSYGSWSAAGAEQRHLIRARAVVRSMEGRVALSHTTALLAHGVAVWGADLSRVHVTRTDGGVGRTERDVVHHEGRLGEGDLVSRHGLLVTSPCRAVLETCTLLPVEQGLVSADSALHQKLVTLAELTAGHQLFEHWPGGQTLQLVLRMADERAASPGESRSRYVFWSQGLPAPKVQFAVYDERGTLVGITDFAWPERGVLGEFDGKVKYGRLLAPGQEPGDVVFEEKLREDRLRAVTGFTMTRLVWADLNHPVTTAARLAGVLGLR